MKRMKEISKRSIWKLLGVVLLALAAVWGSLWLLRSEIQVRSGEDSMERFVRFSQEIDAILEPYGIDAEKYTSVSASEPDVVEDRYAFLTVCIPLEGGYQLYYGMRYEDWSGEKIWCMLISPLRDSAVETVMDLKDERFAPVFEVAEYLSNTYSAKQFKSRTITQQRRLFRYVKEETEEVEGSYSGYDPETIVEENAAYEHAGFTCAHHEASWSYCLGVWVNVYCGVYRYQDQYYSTLEITSELNRS
ncbi:MAG: hypothetical protein E7549_03195 [Ruminococcaceae bacterium]|nr:hypothetical protein [Oscillospiraceae bacterium]